MRIVRHNFLKTTFSLFKINAWINPPKKTVNVDRIAQMNVQPSTRQKACPKEAPKPLEKSKRAVKFCKPTQSKVATMEVGPEIEVNAMMKPKVIGMIEINANTNNAGDKIMYSKKSS